MPQDSLLKSALRSLLKASFAVVGFFITIFLCVVIFSALFNKSELSNTKSATFKQDHKIVILPDANNIRKDHGDSAPVILQVNIEGIIGLDNLKKKDFNKLLVESREGILKDRVKAILLNVNSPGGILTDVDNIFRALKEYKHGYRVPIIAYVDGLCASGGIYVACAADQIYASEVSLIGSVGVLLPTVLNFSKLMETIGIDQKTIVAGKGKDELNPLRPWKPTEGENYQHITDYYYNMFVDILTSHRPDLNREKLIQVYGAKVFPAPEAEQYGFIDGSGYERTDVIKMLLHEAGIGAEDEYQVIALEESSWIERFLFNSSGSTVHQGTIKHQIQLQNDLDPALEGKFLYLYRN